MDVQNLFGDKRQKSCFMSPSKITWQAYVHKRQHNQQDADDSNMNFHTLSVKQIR